MLDNLELVRRVVDPALIQARDAVNSAIHTAWVASELTQEEFFRTHILEYKKPDFAAGYGTQFQLDFESTTFRITQEFRIRKKTEEELALDASQVLPGL